MNVEQLQRISPDELSCRECFEAVIWPDVPVRPQYYTRPVQVETRLVRGAFDGYYSVADKKHRAAKAGRTDRCGHREPL
jgi:hypothetical protein